LVLGLYMRVYTLNKSPIGIFMNYTKILCVGIGYYSCGMLEN